MSCPFSVRRSGEAGSLPRQGSIVDGHGNWTLDDDCTDAGGGDDALTLTHLQLAIQLLTAPTNGDLATAVRALSDEAADGWPAQLAALREMAVQIEQIPNFDYLGEIGEALRELDDSARNALLAALGEQLIHACCSGLIERAFRCLGGDLHEFLSSLDGVHDVLTLQADIGIGSAADDDDGTSAAATGFVCAAVGELIFTTDRPPVAWMLVGSLKALAKVLYGVEASIVCEPVDGDQHAYRYLFDAGEPVEEAAAEVAPQIAVPDLKMQPATFCRAFPWHFVLNRSLDLVQMGKGFGKLYKGSMAEHGRKATTYFRFKRPLGLRVEFREIVRRSNTPFLIVLLPPPGKEEGFTACDLEIKGQMVYCPESDTLLFVGSPFLDGLDGLTCNGLFISDIPLHDATREVILVGEQARAQDGLRRRMDKLKSSIEEGNRAVKEERKTNVSLLHLIFPAEIAESLWLGAAIEAKTYDNVTMLFSDIVGFTSICSTATPFMVVGMLEQLYKDFDEFCGYFDVYKVETIGDAYCVASGLHRPSCYDAHKVAWMALRMIEACARHETHDGQHIRMRIGIHTGTVLTGVVGRKMPRYCLFGHNVTIANKFESGSEECRINISPTTKDWLVKHPGLEFDLQARDPECLPKEYKTAEGTCYFLNGYAHDGVAAEASLDEHIDAAMAAITTTAT